MQRTTERTYKNSQTNFLLQETFFESLHKQDTFNVKLTENGIKISKKYENGKHRRRSIQIQEIIGVSCSKSVPSVASQIRKSLETDVDTDNAVFLAINFYIFKESKREKKHHKKYSTIVLTFKYFEDCERNVERANQWKNSLLNLIHAHNGSQLSKLRMTSNKSYLIFLNPKSGQGNASDMYHKIVAPVFNDSEIQFTLNVTKSANYARNFMRTENLEQWLAVIVIGGDGLFFEVINGVFERPDYKNIVNRIYFGIIPAGSGNGLAKTISHRFSEYLDETPVLSSTISMVNGSVAPMDLVRIETKHENMYSSLACGWGFIANIDILSEKIRYVGYLRFTLWSLKNIITLPKYHGKVSYLPINDDNQQRSQSYLTSLNSPVPSDWIIIEDEFVMVHPTYQTHLSTDCYFCPQSKLDDGIIWLLIIRGGITRSELTTFLIGMSNGTHLPKNNNKKIQMIPCRAFRIEPSDTEGIITVDGEKIKYGPIQGEIIPSSIKVIVSK
uniref:CSON003222 protein n=1 Tax=Culicoides sonorensis TaxID=179676 RepID=A0A336LSK5_CULSO